MVDQLDLKILCLIENASKIVRSVTEREIERGVLYPSVTTMDIKRNMPINVDLNIIDGRLSALENEGYIFYETNRWWLTGKGRKALGKADSKRFPLLSSSSKPIRKALEETFLRFEPGLKELEISENISNIENKKIRAEALLKELKHSYELDLISEAEYNDLIEKLFTRLKNIDMQIETYIQRWRDELLGDIEKLKDNIAKKKALLKNLDTIIS
jgi:hypothetical protein